jgi:Spy/CpxP family protein refolding chaperone
MVRRVTFWLAALAAVASLLPGQTPPQRRLRPTTWAEWRVEGLALRLNLSDSQRQQALTLYQGVEETTRPLEDKLGLARKALREASKNNAMTEIERISAQIGVLSGQIAAVEAKCDSSLYGMLTAEQKQKWDQPFGGRGGGPGGGRGPTPVPGKEGHP